VLSYCDPYVAARSGYSEQKKYDTQVRKRAKFAIEPVSDTRPDEYGKDDRCSQLKGIAYEPPCRLHLFHEV
jgi:hypothetical protein